MIAPSAQGDVLATLRADVEVIGDAPAGALDLLPRRGGVCRLEAGRWRRALPFAWVGRRALVEARLGNDEALLLDRLLRTDGALWLAGALEGEIDGVLPRPPCRVVFQPGPLIDALQSVLAPGAQALPWRGLVEALERQPGAYVRIDSDSDSGGDGGAAASATGALSPPAGLGLAIAGRLRQAYGSPAQTPSVATGPWLRLWADDDERQASVAWDLRTPQVAPVPVWYALDPFELARTPRDPAVVCRVTPVPAMPGEARALPVLVRALLPSVPPGVLRIDAEFAIDAALAEGGRPFSARVIVYPAPAAASEGDTPLVLRFASWRGPRRYRLRVTVVGAHDVVSGPWRDATEDYVLLGRSDLPALPGRLSLSPPGPARPAGHQTPGDSHER
ncbi:hypothetical protein ACQ86G_26005 [Roseateles chitinivorans]|uniref:hypothetical protein n=1 Tax=Roseateles chitinivorans TaxID=2917965 RepID=UPI003D67B57B